MTPQILNIATLVAFAAISVDLMLQIHRVVSRKSSADISLVGECIRLLAVAVVQVKLRFVGDPYLIIGQSCTLVLVACYVAVIIRYRKPHESLA